MMHALLSSWFSRRAAINIIVTFILLAGQLGTFPAWSSDAVPSPLLEKGRAVDWWFVFKFNGSSFPGCAAPEGANITRTCTFGGKVQRYDRFSQQYVYASSENATLEKGQGCAGTTTADPVGATFEQVYNGAWNYVVWNDQFYGDPALCGQSDSCGAPWGHSKGMLVWNDDGAGFVLQVTTPSWPGAASKKFPRKREGNTLGCIAVNNVKFSQHFFAVKLTKEDLSKVLRALANASVLTSPTDAQLVRNGGPKDIQILVEALGKKSASEQYTKEQLSTGVLLISKPSRLHVPPWQLVSAALDGVALRTATWWASPQIYTATKSKNVSCWPSRMTKPGPVEIATTGQWDGKTIGLIGGANHAKIGVSISKDTQYSIFGDMNQQGTLTPPKCDRSQNGRGGLFFVLSDPALYESIANLLDGDTGPTRSPRKEVNQVLQ